MSRPDEIGHIEVDDRCDDDGLHQHRRSEVRPEVKPGNDTQPATAQQAHNAPREAMSATAPIEVDDKLEKGQDTLGEVERMRLQILTTREKVRILVAVLVVGPIWLAIIFAWIEFWFRVSAPTAVEVEAFAIALLSPLVAIGGAVAGFYFGERER
jgi:hypothetical protein